MEVKIYSEEDSSSLSVGPITDNGEIWVEARSGPDDGDGVLVRIYLSKLLGALRFIGAIE